MDIYTYTKKNNINIRKSVADFCQQGLTIMDSSTDIMHKRGHIDRMLKDLANYKDTEIVKKADMEILLTAICWHDTWKAVKGGGGLAITLYQQLAEGVLCARLFKNHAKNRFEKEFINKVAYCIRKHSQVQFLHMTTLESQLLHDLDKLDKWNPERLINVKNEYFATKNKIMFKLFKLYMQMDNERDLKLALFKEEFNKRRKNYYRKLGIV